MNKAKKTRRVVGVVTQAFYWLTFTLLIIIAALVASSAFNLSGGYRLLVVQSGSMSPSIPVGSLIFTKPEAEYQKGDVVTFYETGNQKYLVTHRIAETQKLEDGELFITKGDANDASDSKRIDKGGVVGKVVWALPYAGYAVSFAKTRTGLIALIIIPATLIVYSEILAIKHELQDILAKRKRIKAKQKEAKRLNELERTLRFRFRQLLH